MDVSLNPSDADQLVERPVVEERDLAEAAALAAAITAGPWITDDCSDGGGVIIASMPGGRFVVTTAMNLGGHLSEAEAEANAEFLCKARNLLDRLIQHIRSQAQEREELLARIAELERGATPGQPR